MHELRLIIDSRLDLVGLVGTAVYGLVLRQHGNSLEASEVETCVVEAVTNAVVHAYGGREDEEVVVGIAVDADGIRIRVADTGVPMEGALDIRPMAFNADDPATFPVGGMGLHLMDLVMDRVTYRSEHGRNEILLEKRFSGKDGK